MCLLLSFHLIMPSHTISCIGGNSSIKYMTTGIAGNGRTKEEITDDKSRGGAASLGVAKTKADGPKNDWKTLD